MKTNYLNLKSNFLYSIMGLVGLLLASCGSYRNSSYNDSDGIYSSGESRQKNNQTTSSSNGYAQYFGSLQDDAVVFTDVDNYRTANDTTEAVENRGYEKGYSSWGSDVEDVTVNIYGNSYGYSPYNFWYGPSWNYGWGYPGWYSPGFSIGWGWNSWYGPAYGFGYGYGYGNYYPYWGNSWYGNNYYNYNNYNYTNSIRGVRNEMYGSRNTTRSTNNSSTRNSNYNTRRSNVNTSRTPSYNQSRNPVRSSTTSPGRTMQASPTRARTNNYSPSTNSTQRSYTPSPSSSRSSSTGTYNGGGGGGRSGGAGSRR